MTMLPILPISRPVLNTATVSASRISALLLLLLAPAVVGCGGSPKEGAATVVSGKVTVGGKPAASGSKVVFTGEGGKETFTTVGADGDYSITNPPVGPVKVTVMKSNVPTASDGGLAPAGMKAPEGVAVPEKYSQPKNALAHTVVEGKQTYNIELTP